MTFKASDKPEFSKKWWSDDKPDDIKGTDLEKSLQAVEKALNDEEKKKNDPAVYDVSFVALKDLESAVDKTIKKECDKKKHKDVITVLEKFYGMIKAENRRIEDAKAEIVEGANDKEGDEGDEEDEEDEGKIFQKDYLYKMVKILRSSGKPMNFGFGLNTNAPDMSVLLLKRKGKPEMLFKALKKTGDFSNRCLAYGVAMPDEENAKVLVFQLDDGASEPPQIVKLGRKFLRADKSLLFRKLKVVLPGGKTLIDDEPDTEDEEGGASGSEAATGALQQKLRSATAAAGIWTKARQSAAEQIEELRRELDGFDDVDVKSVNEQLAKIGERYPKLDFTALVGASDVAAFESSLSQARDGIAEWRRVIKSDAALQALDKNPFLSTNVVGTYSDALDGIAGELKL